MSKSTPTGRTIVIGDVHGCLAELQDLLGAVSPEAADRLICVGDLIGKGPDSRGVLEWAMATPNLDCVLGNHEARFLSYWRRGIVPDEKPGDLETHRQLRSRYDSYMRFIERWPLYLARRDCLVVHAGFDPGLGLSGSGPDVLTNIRKLDDGEPWYESYRGRKLVVFGHWARREPVVRDNAIGLDTGCVYGGSLSALILPERRIVSVPARKAYSRKAGWFTPSGSPEEMAWTR